MKRLFYVTYFAYFKNGNGKEMHSVYNYLFYKAPVFFEWIVSEREKLEKQTKSSLVIVNCGKI